MMDTDTPETCRGWRNILRISCASSWLFFTRLYRDARPKNLKKVINFYLRYRLIFMSVNDVMLQHGRKYQFWLHNVKISNFNYVTFITVQNYLHISACTIPWASKENSFHFWWCHHFPFCGYWTAWFAARVLLLAMLTGRLCFMCSHKR
jgi:hypothetical protein